MSELKQNLNETVASMPVYGGTSSPVSIVAEKCATDKLFNTLYQRKEFYKHKSLELEGLLKIEKENLVKSKKVISKWKSEYQKELNVKNSWKYCCFSLGIGFVVLASVVMLITPILSLSHREPEPHRVPTSGSLQQTPNHVLASVNLINGTLQGSGTVISRGPKYAAVLSAGHNFRGNIGGEFWCYFADGTYTKGILLVVDRKRDLALARIDANSILGTSFVPSSVPKGKIEGVGYTNGEGPNLRTLQYVNNASDPNKVLWELNVTSGPFWDGDSGSGAFINGALVGVTTERAEFNSRRCYYKKLYACGHKEIVDFLKENKAKLADCGDWQAQPVANTKANDLPPLWNPKPNIPIYTNNNVEQTVLSLKSEVESLKKKFTETAKSDNLLKRPSDVPE